LPQDLAEKLYNNATVRDSARFQRPKLSQTAFTIQHYAGPVTYQTVRLASITPACTPPCEAM
jgi:myosin-5